MSSQYSHQQYDGAKNLFNAITTILGGGNSYDEEEEDDEMTTCTTCGHYWDGFAQCKCLGIPPDADAADNEENADAAADDAAADAAATAAAEVAVAPDSKSKMTLRSVYKNNTQSPIKSHVEEHPASWDSTTHYGQCGQSCPCCRSEVGDILGACPICKYE
jgi:hypothetical protein